MNHFSVDDLYQGFVDSLPRGLQADALQLPHRLHLAPIPSAKWSEVFNHEVTLGAPMLVAEALPNVRPELVRAATLAHALSVIEAFGSDRIADGQVEPSRGLTDVLERLRSARNRALELILPGSTSEGCAADACTREAIAKERMLLGRLSPVGLDEYEAISLGKQALGFPASLALTRAACTHEHQLDHVERLLRGVWLGLQFEDDVVDWEDDWRCGGAWAVCLAAGVRVERSNGERPTQPDLIRRLVLSSGVLRMLLQRSRRHYRCAWRHSQVIGARRLAEWAKARERRLDTLIQLEQKHAGYAVRMSKLSNWALEVLA